MSSRIEPADPYTWTDDRDGMRIDWQVPIEMDDGIVLRADVFRPIDSDRHPVILTYGIYAKGLAYQEGYLHQWNKMIVDYPEILEGSTNRYQNWEVTDPERWIPHGYVVVRVDSRGAGWSPGIMNPDSDREVEDILACIEWAGTASWSTGKVGMLGISYYARNQWRVAGHKPPHLAAMIPWEGGNDSYRDSGYHGGILSEFRKRWSAEQVVNVQYGRGDRARTNPNTGQSVAGPVTLTDEELAENRRNSHEDLKAHPLFDDWHRERTADLTLVDIPLLTCANWGGQGIHPRGNFNGFVEASSARKWLEVHGDTHWSLFSSGYGLDLQKRFFDHFLKDVENGWPDTPPVVLNIRHPRERFERRDEHEWPLARTKWTRLSLRPATGHMTQEPPTEVETITYDTMGDGAMFWLPTMDRPLEITGPLSATLNVSSETTDVDLFCVLRLYDPDGEEVTFMGSTDPNTPIANGWLRASHRALVPEKTFPYRPFHPHDQVEPLVPGEVYRCEVEFVPTCIVVPPGWQLALNVRGRDYEYTGPLSEFAQRFHYATRGTGGMTHGDPDDRPPEIFDTNVTIHSSPDQVSSILIPVIPPG